MKQIRKTNEIRTNILVLLGIIIISAIVGLEQLDFPNRDFNVIYTFSGDGYSFCALIQSLKENGLPGLYFIDRLGAPDICSYIDISAVDLLTAITLWIISLCTKTPQAAALVYFVFSFVVATVGMYWLLYHLNINPYINAVFSLLFSFTPFHFYRGLGHPNLISIYTIPLGIAIGLFVAFHNDDKQLLKGLFSKKELLICSLFVGFGCSYFLFFLLMMYALAYIYAVIANREKIKNVKNFISFTLQSVWAPVLSVVCVLLGQLPRMIYNIVTGVSNNVMTRSPLEQEIYALKFIQLFLPASYHNNDFFKKITAGYSTRAINVTENQFASLGLFASVGVILLLIIFFLRFLDIKSKPQMGILSLLSVSVVVYLLVSCGGGFGEIFNLLVTPQFRCYNRVSVILAAMGLMAVAIICDQICKNRKLLVLICTCAIFLLGIYDQVPTTHSKYNPILKEKQNMYESFFSKVEDKLEPYSMVYQLPYTGFPEYGPVEEMQDYSHFKGYMFTDTIKWSYGGVTGRDRSAKKLLDNEGIGYRFLSNIKNAGFSGVYIDVSGYGDRADEVLDFYDHLGIRPIVSEDHQLYFYNIENLDIDKRKTEVGYEYIESILSVCGIENDVETCSNITGTLITDSELAAHTIYRCFMSAGVTQYLDEEYISFLYETLLKREPSAEEVAGWLDGIQKGFGREEILYEFIKTPEFYSKSQIPVGQTYEIKDGVDIDFTQNDWNADDYVMSGISGCESEYTWTEGDTLKFVIFKTKPNQKVRICIDIDGVHGESQVVDVMQEGALMDSIKMKKSGKYEFDICANDNGIVELKLLFLDAYSPSRNIFDSDKRILAVKLKRISISPI